MKSQSARLVLAPVAASLLALAAPVSFALAEPAADTGSAAQKIPVQLPPPAPGKGQVVFYRKPMVSLIPFNWIAREGKTEICEMVAGTYCVAVVDPGRHTYEVHSESKNDLTLEVDAGETYYVIGGISMGLIVNRPNISPAQKAQFDALSAKLKSKAPFPAAAGLGSAAPDALEKPTPPEAVPAASSTPAPAAANPAS